MEERLFWICLAMLLFSWGTRYGTKTGRLDAQKATSLWHALFCAIAGFAATLVAVMSIESRAKYTGPAVGALSLRELFPSLAGGTLCALWGGWSAWGNSKTAEGRKYYHAEDLEWADTISSAVLLAALMMYFIVQAFKIPSGSMRSTLLEGDHLFVNKFIYGVRVPFTKLRLLRLNKVDRGDVVVFQFPSDNPQELHCGSIQYGKDFIKRAIGLPGDTVEVKDGVVIVNGQALRDEPYTQYIDNVRQGPPRVNIPPQEYQQLWQTHQLDRATNDGVRDAFGPVAVPAHSYFVMGDNRDRSCDSRFWGPVDDHYIKGKAWVIYWPPSRIRKVR